MAYDVEKAVKLGQLKTTTERIKARLDALQAGLDTSIKSGKTENNTVYLYTSSDATGTPVFSFDFPSELFLDQTRTAFVVPFAFSEETYPGATNPDLDGKPVLVFAVKRQRANEADTITYSFLNLEYLIDIYEIKAGDSAKVLDIADGKIEFRLSSDAGNALVIKNDGLYVGSGKVTGATAGNLAGLAADGSLMDSGIGGTSVLLRSDLTTDEEFAEMLAEVLGATTASGTTSA